MSPIERALLSLKGLSVGDAFGETFFGPNETVLERIDQRVLRPGPWRYTDDTEMALSVVGVLRDCDGIVQDELARRFFDNMTPHRGYGGGAFAMLTHPCFVEVWRTLSRDAFEGRGSFGNGAAMRVAPIGAYFADDLDLVVEHARRSAEVTHAHPEGIAGAVAIAVGTALLAQVAGATSPIGPALLELALERTPPGVTRNGIGAALALQTGTTVREAARALGNGAEVSAQDTVPLCLWVASRKSHDYEEALWETVAALGDRDTTCAIVGGMVAMQCGTDAIPQVWKSSREPLPNMMLATELEKVFFG